MVKESFDYIFKGCINNNTKCQKLLYDKYSPRLYAICLRYLKKDSFADDVLQDSFLKIFKSLKNLKKTEEKSVYSWMCRIVVNTSITHINREKDISDVDMNAIPTPDKQDPYGEYDVDMKVLTDMLNSLADGYRLVFNLYAIEGYNHKEISEIMGISQQTSKSQYSRAKQILRNKISEIQTLKT